MVPASFYDWRVEVDPDTTRASHAQLEAPEPMCCNACATFREALHQNSFPAAITDFLARAGADPAKVQEVWGAPDAGFLNGSWVVVGRMLEREWDGSGERAYVEPVSGMKCWITGKPSMHPSPVFDGQPLFQLEFEWYDERRLPELESVARSKIHSPGGAA